MQPPAPSISHTRNPISLSELDRRRFSGRRGNVITSSLTEEQERRMDGHPWPTTTPYCKTPATLFLLSARTWIHVHDNVTPYTWSIYRFARRGLNDSTPVNRDECVRVCGHLLPSTPGGCSALSLRVWGTACPTTNHVHVEREREDVSSRGSGISLEEFEEDSGVRFLFSSGWRRSVVNDGPRRSARVYRIRYEDPEGNGERSEWSDFERNRARRCFFSIRPGIGSDWAGCVELVLEIWEFFVREFNFFFFFFFSNARISMDLTLS